MEHTRYKFIVLHRSDSVAVAMEAIPDDALVRLEDDGMSTEIRLRDAIDFGHKFAIKPIARGDDILKYGEIIGRAIADIEPGEHVHVHNLEGNRGRGDRLGDGNV